MSEETSDCFNKHLRDFLVSVTIHKARNLNVLDADTLVIVNFNDETKRTKTFQNSDCPFFNEYFVFELRTTLDELLKKNLRLIMTRENCFLKKNAIIGDTNVNLGTIWKQNYHSFLRKWATLEKIGNDKKNLTTGYLQVDLTIVTTNEPPAPSILKSFDDDIIEENLLLPDETSSDQESVKYFVNIFEGNFVIKRDYILQVSYGSRRTRTSQQKYTKICKWNEQLIFRGLFQSLSQMFVFEILVFEQFQWKVKCSTEVHFSSMSWKNEGIFNKPFFGPGFIYFYEGVQKNIFFGKLLVSIITEDIDPSVVEITTYKQDILMPLNESEYWNEEIFKVNMVLVGLDALSLQQNRVKIYLSCENIFSNAIDLDVQSYKNSKMKVKFVEFNSNIRPVMSLSIKLPDNRLKLQLINLVQMLITEMDENIINFKLFEAFYHDNVKYQRESLKLLQCDLSEMLKGLKKKLFHRSFKKVSEWDENFLKNLRFVVETCVTKVGESLRKLEEDSDIKEAFQEYYSLRDSLEEALSNFVESLPDLYLNVSCDGKLLAFHRFKMMNYFHSQAFDARGKNCGKIQTLLLKPTICTHTCLNCGCLFGKFDILLWIGSSEEVNEWMPQNCVEMASNKINFLIEKFYKCNVYVHQSKIQPRIEKVKAKFVITSNGLYEETKIDTQSLSSIWNEVLVIENIKAFDIGKHSDYPSIAMFLFDEERRKMHLIGTGTMKISVKNTEVKATKQIFDQEKFDIRNVFHQFVNHYPPYLRWISFYKDGTLAAEVLMSAEFIQLQAPSLTLRNVEKNDPIPVEIRPEMKKFRVEITFIGIRGDLKLSLFASGRFKIELSMGDLILSSGFSGKAYKTNLNFLDPHASGYIMLPDQIHYWPPIIINHLDCSHKRPRVIGTMLIRRPEKFFFEEKPKEIERFLLNTTIDVETQDVVEQFDIEETQPLLARDSKPNMKWRKALDKLPNFPKFLKSNSSFHQLNPLTLENEYSWWTKFYNSNRKPEFRNNSIQHLTIFHNELEKESKFEKFHDWAAPIDLARGGTESKKSETYAKLKCAIKISKCYGKEYFESGKEEMFSVNFPRFKRNLMLELPIVVRLYVVEALNLRSRDIYGNSDAFIKVELGRQTISDRSHFVANQFNPVFGKRFQLNGVIPRNNLLKISVFDYDSYTGNDLIGNTVIDLEDRVRTKYLAACGLPNEFNSSGYNTWRNSNRPSEILEHFCNELELSHPQYFPDHVKLAGIEFKDSSKITKDENKKERLALSVLKRFHELPRIGFPFVPEHVETRSLYRKDRPGVEQGKLLMWIEIFDSRKIIPEAIDITPVPPRPYELRIIVWNAKDVILDEKNIFGKKMSDIYVKGWLHNHEEVQFTDIHYRSINGDGNFNWRMIFPLKYSVGEDMRSPLEKFDSETKQPPMLTLQIWDNDSFSADDFLGTLSINLSHFIRPFTSSERCSIKNSNRPYENLFAINGSIRGWFPVYGRIEKDEAIRQTGKLELELEVLLQEKAIANSVGIGRDGPKSLSPPNRPETSFNWITQPMKSMKLILWPQIKKAVLIAILVLLCFLFFALIIMNFPNKVVAKAVDEVCDVTS